MKQGAEISIIDVTSSSKNSNYLSKEDRVRAKQNRELVAWYKNTFKSFLPKEIKVIELQEKRDEIIEEVKPKRDLKTMQEFLETEAYPPELRRSIQSIFITHIAKSATVTKLTRHQKRNILLMVKTFFRTYHLLGIAKEDNEFDIVLSLNGRKADQAAVTYFCRKKELKQYFFENGSTPGKRYYIAPTEPQNVLQFQAWFKKVILNEKSAKDQMMSQARARKWFEDRISTPPNFGQGLPSREAVFEFTEKGETVGLFLSSIGEMDYFEGNIQLQLQAWRRVLEDLARHQVANVVVRFHPNMLNYSWADTVYLNAFFKDALKKYPKIRMVTIQPWSNISSYEILKKVDSVITWNSTIALEAAYQGLPICVLTNTFYSAILEIDPFSCDEEINVVKKLKKVPQQKTLEACNVLLDNGESVCEDVLVSNLAIKLTEKSNSRRKNVSIVMRRLRNLRLKSEMLVGFNRTPFNSKQILNRLFSRNQMLAIMKFLLVVKLVKHKFSRN